MSCSQGHRNMSSNERVTQPADIMLVGGSAIRLESKTPEVTDYKGPMYHHQDFIESPFKDIDLNVNDGLLITHAQNRGGLFRPHSSLYNVPMNTSRPLSESPYPPSTTPVPTSISPKPPLGPRSDTGISKVSSRPTSAYSRPQSSLRPLSRYENNTLINDLDIDPDHEPMTDVLSRLNQYSQNYGPSLQPAYTDCECTNDESKLSDKQASMYDSDSDDNDDDDEGTAVSIDVLLKMFHQYEDKGHSTGRQKAMMTLVDSYTSVESLTEQQSSQLYNYLTTSQLQVQDACLVLLKQCVKNSSNLVVLLEKEILEHLYECLLKEDIRLLRRSALLLMESIFVQTEYKSYWYDVSVTKLLPKLISMVRGSLPLDVKYAACCVFRSFALHEEFIQYTIDEILPSVLLMRNASAKFKEVYVEILTRVLSHTDCIPSDLIDNSAIPITVSIIREGPCGPQCAAFHLLSSLTTNDSGVSMVIGTDSLIPMLLCCMKTSHCRKVRHNATEVMKNVSASRKLGLCKDVMLQIGKYLVPSSEPESLNNLSQTVTNKNLSTAVKSKFDDEHQMWAGLEKFIDMAKSVVYREAKVETDELERVTKIHMKPCIDTCSTQLGLLIHTFHILQHICLWPLDKSRLGFSANRVDLTTFTDDDQQRVRLSKVNRGLTQAIWDKVGMVATDLLLSYAEKLSSIYEEYQRKGLPVKIDLIFESQELTLINKLLELILCSSLCTCTAFSEILPKLAEKSSKNRSKSPNKLKSFSTSHVTQVNSEHKCGTDVESRLKSQSDTSKGFVGEDNKLWVRENPHLSGLHGPGGRNSAEKSKADLKHKEACTERRLLRKCIYESHVFACVCPFMKCTDENIQVLVLQILRCLIQPLEERVAPKLTCGKPNTTGRQRPQTASAVQGSSRRLNIALQKMSPDMADLMKEAMGLQLDVTGSDVIHNKSMPQTSVTKVNIPGNGLESIQERLQEFTESNKAETDGKKVKSESPRLINPVIDRCRPIAQQCREALVDGIGEKLVLGIFSRCHVVKKQCVLILHDFVHYGESECHMKLSQYQCMPRLIDFLRVNEDNELLEVMCLIIVRMLVCSDSRLKQLFNRHGGSQLLLSMAQYSKGLLKQEVSTTLKTVSKVESVKKRPMSAPVLRSTPNARAPDIWDYIGSRWKQEDQVATVLRKWMIDDKKHRKK